MQRRPLGHWTDAEVADSAAEFDQFKAFETAMRRVLFQAKKLKATTAAGIYAKALIVRSSRSGAMLLAMSLAEDLIACPGLRESLWPAAGRRLSQKCPSICGAATRKHTASARSAKPRRSMNAASGTRAPSDCRGDDDARSPTKPRGPRKHRPVRLGCWSWRECLKRRLSTHPKSGPFVTSPGGGGRRTGPRWMDAEAAADYLSLQF